MTQLLRFPKLEDHTDKAVGNSIGLVSVACFERCAQQMLTLLWSHGLVLSRRLVERSLLANASDNEGGA